MVEVTDERRKRIAAFIAPLRVRPGTAVDLGRDFDPGYRSDVVRKKDGRELLETGIAMLAEYQRGGDPALPPCQRRPPHRRPGVGDPTEGALLVLAYKAGLDIDATRERLPRLAPLPFDSSIRLMATFHATTGADGRPVVRCFVKGAATKPSTLAQFGWAVLPALTLLVVWELGKIVTRRVDARRRRPAGGPAVPVWTVPALPAQRRPVESRNAGAGTGVVVGEPPKV
jgi:Cation transport ATPase (P-type)